jgi:DNA polymerase delta subunit 1
VYFAAFSFARLTHSPHHTRTCAPSFGDDFELEEQIAAELAGEDGEQLLPPEEYAQLAASAAAAEAVSEAAMARWRRPPVAPFDPKGEALELQWLDVDMTVGKRLAANPAGGKVPGAPSGLVPIVRFYGVTPKGNSVAVFVHGFTPYLYAACPKPFLGSEAAMRQALNARLLSDRQRGGRGGGGGGGGGGEEAGADLCLGVAIETDKRSILGYAVDSAQAFFKIFVATPNLVPTVKRILDDGLDVPGFGRLSGVLTYESNVPFVLRFMIDKEITGAGWLECPAGTYAVRKEVRARLSVSVSV